MHSQQLETTFNETYTKFYMENEIVFSVPFLINWAGDIHSTYTGISIKQKIPLRMYMGLSKRSEHKFVFDKLIQYDTHTNNFLITQCYNTASYFLSLTNYLNNTYGILLESCGYSISILAEGSRGMGIGFNPLVTTLCSILVNYLSDIDKTPEYWAEEMKKGLYDNLNDNFSLLRKVVLESINFDLNISPYPSLTSKISSMVSGYYPVVGFRSNNLDFIDVKKINLFAFRYNELRTELPDIPTFPIDLSLVYSGKPVIGEQLISSDKNYSDRTDSQHQELIDIFKPHIEHLNDVDKPVFYTNYLTENADNITEIYGKSMGAISIEVLSKLSGIFKKSFNENVYEQFIRVLNKIRYGNFIIRKNSKEYLDFIVSISELFGNKKDYIGIIPNDSISMGGTVTVISPLESNRAKFLNLHNTLESEYPGISLLYTNWQDGVSFDGLVINQNINIGHYSRLLKYGGYILVNEKKDHYFGELYSLRLTSGIVLDTTSNKIYINGEKITSQYLNSQNTTIEMLMLYLNNKNEPVSSKQLSISSFSKNKGEFNNKIIKPFIDLIHNKLQKEINIELSGKTNDFYMNFIDFELPISYIEVLK